MVEAHRGQRRGAKLLETLGLGDGLHGEELRAKGGLFRVARGTEQLQQQQYKQRNPAHGRSCPRLHMDDRNRDWPPEK